jgi:hypothetical protein
MVRSIFTTIVKASAVLVCVGVSSSACLFPGRDVRHEDRGERHDDRGDHHEDRHDEHR